MAVVHCLGTGLVGAWVAKRLATLGHEVHAYDLEPHRVMGIDGITVHPGDVLDNLIYKGTQNDGTNPTTDPLDRDPKRTTSAYTINVGGSDTTKKLKVIR